MAYKDVAWRDFLVENNKIWAKYSYDFSAKLNPAFGRPLNLSKFADNDNNIIYFFKDLLSSINLLIALYRIHEV